MWRRTLNGWGYSPLDQIDRDTVADLRMVWSRGLGPGLQQGTPLVRNGVMYMPNPRDLIQALDAVTGDLLWQYQRDRPDDLADYLIPGLIDTNRNIAIYDTLIFDSTTDDYVIALDATTGEVVWETEVLDYQVDPANQTSGPIVANGKVISGRSCDPRGGPHACVIVAHDALTGSTLALNADTGEIDTAVRPDPTAVSWINPRLQPGEERRVLTGIPGKTGVVYTLDRETGEFLWATPTITQNVISGIDGATGAVSENAELVFTAQGQVVLACPHASGGKDWEAGAYSPLTNTMYMPLRNVCARMRASTFEDEEASRLYAIAWRSQLAPGTDQVGAVHAISAETGATTWVYEQRAATMSLVATGGGLVFGGDVNGRFRAFDDQTGEVLWEINLGSSVSGFPITYAVDGRQYVAVSTGTPRFINLTPELRPSLGNNLFVFALPESAASPTRCRTGSSVDLVRRRHP